MGANVSSESFEKHLEKQEQLVKRLEEAVQRSAERLQTAGSLAIDYSADGDGYPEDENEDARSLLAGLYKRARDLNSLPPVEPALDEAETEKIKEKSPAITQYDGDSLVYKPWLSSLVEPEYLSSTSTELDSTAPSVSVELKRALGFSGSMLRCAEWIDKDTFVYAVGGVVVVVNNNNSTSSPTSPTASAPKQRFFREHNSTVSTLAVHQQRRIVASCELGFLPMIIVWNVDTLQKIHAIADEWRTGIMAITFSPDGGKIAAADYSDFHLLGLYDWEAGRMVARAENRHDIFDLCFCGGGSSSSSSSSSSASSEYSTTERIVTVGDRNIFFWKRGSLLNEEGEEEGTSSEKLHGTQAQIGNAGKKQSYTAVTTTANGNVVVGTQNGELYIFNSCEKQRLIRILDVQSRMISCLASYSNIVIVGGYDGTHLSSWNIASFKKVATLPPFVGSSAASAHSSSSATSAAASSSSVPSVASSDSLASPIHSLSVSPDGSTILAGNTNNQLSRIDVATKSVFTLQHGSAGHIGDCITAIAVHPTKPRVAVGGSDFQVVEFDTETCAVLRVHRISAHATSLEYSPASSSSSSSGGGGGDDAGGGLLAVGLSTGTVCIFCGNDLTHSFSVGKRRVQCVRFSGSGRLLAAGTADNVVEVYDSGSGSFAHVAQLKQGLQGVVINIDFAVSENILRVSTQSYELVFFDILKKSRLDDASTIKSTLWSTHTSLFGYEAQGIWRRDTEFNDVNAVSRTSGGAQLSKRMLVTAETTGLVKIFRFPCIGGGLDVYGNLSRRPDSIRLRGHVSNVLGADFFQKDSGLVTASPDCLFVWDVKPE